MPSFSVGKVIGSVPGTDFIRGLTLVVLASLEMGKRELQTDLLKSGRPFRDGGIGKN